MSSPSNKLMIQVYIEIMQVANFNVKMYMSYFIHFNTLPCALIFQLWKSIIDIYILYVKLISFINFNTFHKPDMKNKL